MKTAIPTVFDIPNPPPSQALKRKAPRPRDPVPPVKKRRKTGAGPDVSSPGDDLSPSHGSLRGLYTGYLLYIVHEQMTAYKYRIKNHPGIDLVYDEQI